MLSSLLTESIRGYVPAVLRATATPGASLAILDTDGDSFTEGFGWADLAQELPMRPDNVMPGGSLSKMYCAAATMQLVEQGLVDIHRPVNDYIDAFEVRNRLDHQAVTVYDLLTHTSGLATDFVAAREVPQRPLVDELRAVYAGAHTQEYGGAGWRWVDRRGARYHYSSLGMATLGYLVEVVNRGGRQFSEVVDEDIFRPLAMDSSHIPAVQAPPSLSSELMARRAVGYMRFGEWCVPTRPVRSGIYPATNLVTTPGDQVRFLASLLRTDHLSQRVLTTKTVREMFTPQSAGNAPGELPGIVTGLGFQGRNLGSRSCFFGHEGAWPFGWWCEARVYPLLGFAVCVMCNVWDGVRFVNPADRTAPGAICDFVADAMGGADVSRARHAHDWEAQASYAVGLLVGERARCLLGLPGPVGTDTVAEMMAGARRLPNPQIPDRLDGEQFARAIADLNTIDLSGDAVRTFLASARCQVDPHVLDLAALAFGASRAKFPMPMDFWSDGAEGGDFEQSHLSSGGDQPWM